MHNKNKNIILSIITASIIMMPSFANAYGLMEHGYIESESKDRSISHDQLMNSHQVSLSEACGIDIIDLKKDIIMRKDAFISGINIINDNCDIEVGYLTDNKSGKATISIHSEDFIVMLAEVEDRNDGLTTNNHSYNLSLRRDGILYLLKDYIESSENERTRLTKLFHKRFSGSLKSKENTVNMTKYINTEGRASKKYLESHSS